MRHWCAAWLKKCSTTQAKVAEPAWTTYETVAVCALVVVALFAHFWRIQVPGMLVYDEHIYVEEAYKYLGKEAFFEVHPPLAISLIAICVWLFGCHSWSWRVSSAICRHRADTYHLPARAKNVSFAARSHHRGNPDAVRGYVP